MKPKIFTCIPYDIDMHLEDSYNNFMAQIPDDAWACFIDHDAMFTTKYWYQQLQAIIENNSKYSCFTVVTNRCYNKTQKTSCIGPNNHNIIQHRMLGEQLQKEQSLEVEDITQDTPISGVVILYKKAVWKKIPFRKWPERNLVGVDWMLHNDLKDKGYFIGLMSGVYVYHWYREVFPVQTEGAKVLIGMPMRTDYKVDYEAVRFCAVSMRKGWHWLNAPSVEPTVARNILVSQFLHRSEFTDYTHLFLLDADTVPPPDTIDKLLAHDKDIISGVTPIRIENVLYWNFQFLKNKKVPGLLRELPKEVTAVQRVGGTTMLLKRKVLEAIRFPHFKVEYPETVEQALKTGPISKGSDYNFSDKVIEAGFQIYIDPEIRCKHIRPVDLLTLVLK